ncbi:YggS family pyridoxal phosphate-dependent enzyme [Halomonas sp. McH1-25]|uniref:YggS family pyridoxal phosphate-dependent enzyme n=1 Tax=unclassified Halomonas TaxID=2609666 RepID=UPI001EF49E98|nr:MULTISPECIES: YggS family pyridoxal phosphate-dependent enzyme [unclassified Halomonas]MCG7599416.1 YggS family pyridoxal phosphate-dependent enzyme [Halomonas sp. McH1-25]MCP1344279.1 YggS family pyridoxal phosphate-dependent enzyme [Halomonas sp. FL8]MCP1362842.1 YggS family pyridoxal phosphate-dependent enzyme [Halomonas sp. BBD45]
MPDVQVRESLQRARQRLADALESAGRPADDARLLAVSKTKPAALIREAYACRQRDFGENYLQEALDKQAELADLTEIVWHFIGPLQSNKTRAVAEHFDWVHSIDRAKVARRLSEQRPASLGPLNVCLQVNVSGEESKSGVEPEDLEALAAEIVALPNLRLRGLMAIPAPATDMAAQRRPLARLRQLLDTLRQRYPHAPLDTLSMGMSDDLEAAILEGATLVRLGTAIFGARAPRP